jgi:xanthine dehydrogenase YagR molybdenum-binding subunit
MEPHATIAQWNGDNLTIHDTTQNITGHKRTLAKIFGLPENNVRVISLFLGGAFGCKGEVWSHSVLAAMASRQVERPVKLVLDRPQMFGPIGARPRTHQRITLGAARDGRLTAIRHEVHAHTSFLEDYLESAAFPTRVMYSCINVSTTHRLVPLNLGTPTYMRAPGVATGTYAIEVALDELAYELKMDPLQLRLLNYAEVDPQTKLPFTEKSLRECYSRASDRFGWSRRTHEPRSMRDGNQLIGWGMATETYPANRRPAEALVRMKPDGRILVATGTHEIGGGTYTVLAQVAAEALDMSPEMIDVVIGDTNLPEAPITAGSMTTASVTPAVYEAATQLKTKLRNKTSPFEATARIDPQDLKKQYSSHSFGAIFAEVACDANLGTVRVRRIVAVYDVGRLMNEKTARSQFIGGIVWGISLALLEETHIDPQTGRILNGNLAEYHVPVNADIRDIDVSALDIPDTKVDVLGARGIGEIGITGTGAAIANAVFHATGKRVRDLPITPEKLIA